MARKKKKVEQPESRADFQAAALEQYRPLLSEADFVDLQAELERPLYPALRVNNLKAGSPAAAQTWADRYGWQLRPVPYCPSGFWVTESPAPVSQTIEHRLGFYYIQDAASMLPVELFDLPTEHPPLCLDMAASPGGKTTHLIDRNGDRGLVIANDSSADRITALRIVLQNYGALNVAVTRFPGEKFGAWYPETFDRVLLDAPCSMQGLKTTESHPMRPITEKEKLGLATRQARLLASALQAVKVGGQVVYSTCTLEPEEDEGVLDALLNEYPGTFEVFDLSQRLTSPAPALKQYGEQTFNPQVQGAARLWPHRFGTAGFFAALLIKTGEIDALVEKPPYRPLEQVGQSPVGNNAQKALSSWLFDTYGFDLLGLMKEYDLDLWRRSSTLYAVPAAFLRDFRALPAQLLGLPLGEEGPDGLVLSHEWVARFGLSFNASKLTLPADLVPAWLRGEDLHSPPEHAYPKGRIVVVTDDLGRNLGRGKILTERLKNLLPTRVI